MHSDARFILPISRSWSPGAFVKAFFLGLLFVIPQAYAADVTLIWEPGPEEQVSSYRVYYGLSSGEYENFVVTDEGFAARITGLKGGSVYYFAATALNGEGLESGYSNEVEWQAPEDAPEDAPPLSIDSVAGGIVKISVVGQPGATYEIECSEDLQTWASLAVRVVPQNGLFTVRHFNAPPSACFYRRVLISSAAASEIAELESQ